jgi:hypothetical protein
LIVIVTPFSRRRNRPISIGARALVVKIQELGVDAAAISAPVNSAFSVSWGKNGGTLNNSLPPNKLWELKKCHEAGVITVPFSATPDHYGEQWFGRLLKHTKGRDITTNHNEQRDFWTRVIPKRREHRVHVFGGLAVRSGTKVKPDGTFTDEQPIWNLDHGFQIRYEHEVPRGAKELAKAAVKACGLDFAAVDVLEGTDGQFYFLELNTAPGLHGNTCQKYAEKIIAAYKEKVGTSAEQS